jgi:VIT1/CCC1 family predicted Fe2+/Mn2+ transporter
MAARHRRQTHYINRIGWLRAAVLGANDGILSTGSLIIGVAAAAADHRQIFLTGLAGLVAGAMSMAAGEYVSVSSQADTEKADLETERAELEGDRTGELRELAGIYERRGLSSDLARQVAEQLTAKDPLGAHARDELGISEVTTARPIQAALASAASFSSGAALPLLTATLVPTAWAAWGVGAAALVGLVLLGVIGARAGGANIGRALVRVVFWGVVAMAITAGAGVFFGARV